MNRTEYLEKRRTMRALMHTKRRVIRFNDYADSRLVVQIENDAQTVRDIQRRVDQIRMDLPSCGTDPLGFRVMTQNWARRRSHVLARLKAAAARDNDAVKYERAHRLYFAHQAAMRRAA